METFIFVLVGLCLLASLLIFIGIGDWLILAFVIMPEKERKQYDLVKVRIVVGIMLILMAGITATMAYMPETHLLASVLVIGMIGFIGVIFIETWAKKLKYRE